MTLLHRIRKSFEWLCKHARQSFEWLRKQGRAAKIRRLQQDIDWARASSDAHIRDLVQARDALIAQMDGRCSDEIVRDAERSAKGFA